MSDENLYEIIGFSGTQKGMTPHQHLALTSILVGVWREYAEFRTMLKPEAHHGDCVGSDAEFDALARELGFLMNVHPPANPSKQAHCGRPGDVIWVPQSYLDRDKAIARACTRLIAAPRTSKEQLRSGTWATVRYARAMKKPVTILEPTT